MRLLKPLVIASAFLASGSAFAQGRSAESDMSQGIRNGNLAFTQQMQDRGFFGMRGFFGPGLTNGYVGDRNYRAQRRSARGPALYNVPGTMDYGARPQPYYNEPQAYRNRSRR